MHTEKLFDRIESVNLRSITKKFNENYALKNLNLDVIGGELLVLIGGSGSGKTTTLKIINRLITPDKGTVEINGINTKKFDEVTLRRNIGYVIQQIGLFPHLTVKENIGLVPKLDGWDDSKLLNRVEYLLNLVDLSPDIFLNRYPKELSGGQQQRVGLARSLAMDPRLILMDEPFGALDPILRKQLQQEFDKIKRDIGRTIIFVTHDIDEAFKLGDRIAIMHEGKLVQVGTPEELLINPANDHVADLVDADRKFRHINNLKIKDLMIPIDKKHIFNHDMNGKDALQKLIKNNIERAILKKDNTFYGWVTLNDLLINQKVKSIEELSIKPSIFHINDSVEATLKEMKKQKQSTAIILENEIPVGIMLADEILLRLV